MEAQITGEVWLIALIDREGKVGLSGFPKDIWLD